MSFICSCTSDEAPLKSPPDFILKHYKKDLPKMGFTEDQILDLEGQAWATRGLLKDFKEQAMRSNKKIHKDIVEYTNPIINALKELSIYCRYHIKKGLEVGKIKDQNEEDKIT